MESLSFHKMASYEIDHIEIINGEEVGIIYVDDDNVRPMLIEYKENGDTIIQMDDDADDISDDDSDDDDYDGGGDDDVEEQQYGGNDGDYPYSLENKRERHITKFNVRGYEFRLRIPGLAANIPYLEAVQLLHHTLNGKSYSFLIICYYLFPKYLTYSVYIYIHYFFSLFQLCFMNYFKMLVIMIESA